MDGEAMPENVMRLTDKTTTSTPHELFRPLDVECYRNIFLASEGDVFCVTTFMDLPEILKSYEKNYQVHVLRSVVGKTATEFADEEIDPVFENPWAKKDWFKREWRRWVELLPVQSLTKPGYVAYYQTPEKRARNIRTPIKAGRFLFKYFGDLFTQVEIETLAAEWELATQRFEVKITQDADEIQEVYQGRHLDSCMWFPEDEYAGPVHPARVYAGPDLAIAYIGPSHHVDARILVWPEKKIYADKGYGDVRRLTIALNEMGYREGDDCEFTGARIRRISCSRGFVLPYIDTHDSVRDDGTYLLLGRGNICAQPDGGGEGVSEEEDDRRECDECFDRMNSDEEILTYDHNWVCDHCIDTRYFRCDETEEYHPNHDMASTPDNYCVSTAGVKEGPWFYCDQTNLWYPEADYTQVSLIEGGYCVNTYAEANGFYCEYHEEWSLETSKQLKLLGDKSIHLDSFRTREELLAWLKTERLEIYDEPHPDQLYLELEAA